ncbi:hypothetical protein QEH42_gp151 [Microbacterium phage Pumpernickel]|uniref:Uncharacterized protein n=1 Tax=Microbacterium phage Pumpernickel TaxID=2885983 RepID=A0AAE9C307_9CAUD|nr:hypothetical protein QEH42_gp016 [Microbacterium phage Pumpernickel]YP_010755307.1 hypothetical protein QEH42_gp151 [Microbacterium phage Pumpernickel]UDL15807.1 hypothetical protein SEA_PUMPERNICKEL_16 [Microbacterium phage Pumpernickel]UDL16067.1 hypothetical protein SEA_PUMPERNICKEL_317 [Microbacterium phage Pumpernickel]
MGTRGLTAVVKDGNYLLAQYGQWDHYPGGQGVTALNFLKSGDLDKAVANLEARGEFITDEKYDEIAGHIGDGSGWITMEEAEQIDALLPFLSRDLGAGVLRKIADSEDGPIYLRDQHEFASDGLFCEYAYLVDLDTNRFEVFVGFQHHDHTDGRFAALGTEKDFKPEYQGQAYYAPVRLMASWPLDSLPSEDQFLKTLAGVERFYTSQRDDYDPADYEDDDVEAITGPVVVDAVLS